MIKRLFSFLLLSLFAMSVNGATTITFEELGTKTCCFANEPPLTNQYAGLGVNFSGGWEVLNQSGAFGIGAMSGEHFAAYNTSVPGVTNTLEMLFDNNIAGISGYLGSRQSDIWTVSAFSGTTPVLATIFINDANSYVPFSLTGLLGFNIDRITIQGSASSGVLENLTFQAVPIPAAVWLFGSGILGLLGLSRRRKA
jgi:hypothetical protein